MEPVTLMIQSGIGSIFTIYGICSLLSNRKNPNKGKTVLPPVCILVGISLLGYAVSQIL